MDFAAKETVTEISRAEPWEFDTGLFYLMVKTRLNLHCTGQSALVHWEEGAGSVNTLSLIVVHTSSSFFVLSQPLKKDQSFKQKA